VTPDQIWDTIAEFANLLIFGYICGLRGEELVKVDLSGFLKYLEIGSQHPEFPHRWFYCWEYWRDKWVSRTVPHDDPGQGGIIRLSTGEVGGPIGSIFAESRKKKMFSRMPEEFRQRLALWGWVPGSDCEHECKERFPVWSRGDVVQVYSLRRSLQRGSTSEAINKKVPQLIIKLNNRWRQLEVAKGRRPRMLIMAHYREIRLSIPMLWRCSWPF
jgi:hypothetical protein